MCKNNTVDYKITRNDFVASSAGRDKGRIFVVSGSDGEEYLLLCDGMLRKVEKPKRKKRKHAVKLDAGPYGGPMTNRAVSRAVKETAAALDLIKKPLFAASKDAADSDSDKEGLFCRKTT